MMFLSITDLTPLGAARNKGRARQMNAGAAAASGDMLLFLHADSLVPCGCDMLFLYKFESSHSPPPLPPPPPPPSSFLLI